MRKRVKRTTLLSVAIAFRDVSGRAAPLAATAVKSDLLVLGRLVEPEFGLELLSREMQGGGEHGEGQVNR